MKKCDLTANLLREILEYDPSSGIFTWKQRHAELFSDGKYSAVRACSIWNAKLAGKAAGCPSAYGYTVIRIQDRLYGAHRLAWLYMTGEWPEGEVDHRDLDKSNNAWSNLRPATHQQNSLNCKIRRHNRLGVKGVCFHKETGKYRARITTNREVISLGLYETPKMASAAYADASAKYHMEYGRQN